MESYFKLIKVKLVNGHDLAVPQRSNSNGQYKGEMFNQPTHNDFVKQIESK